MLSHEAGGRSVVLARAASGGKIPNHKDPNHAFFSS
jgi:hypothetical protein